MAKKTITKRKDTVEFLSTAKKRFDRLQSVDWHNRESARHNIEFVYNINEGQWPEEIRDDRKDRPCLVSNKLHKFVAHVANQERDQRLAGNVRPVDDKGDVATAEIMSGLIRQIEHASDAQRVYTGGGKHAIAAGFGFWRITARELDESFDQELRIEEIKNQFQAWLDCDRMFGFVREKIRKDEFKDKYPDAIEEDYESNEGFQQSQEHWYDDEHLFIADYYYKERVKTEIVQVRKRDRSRQTEGESKIFELDENITEQSLTDQDWTIEKKKTLKIYKVRWAKITASQILEEGEWAGKEIPLIPVEGEWINYDGKVYKRGLTDDAHDDQRMYNYWKSYITESVALAIKAPYLVTTNMIKGLEKFWKNAHKTIQSYLPFKGPVFPKRESPPSVPTGAAAMLQVTAADIQDTIGRYEASFGEKSNERSGVAIQERASRSEFSTFHFHDNFRRSVLETMRQLIDLIPQYYDTDRVVRILGDSGASENHKQDLVRINTPLLDKTTGFPIIDKEGRPVILHDLKVGKYDLVEDAKMMSTRRQEMLEGMKALAAGSPQLSIFLAPKIAKAQDWPGHEDIAEEMKVLIPAMLGIKPPDGQVGSGERGEPLPEDEPGNTGDLL